MPAYLCHCWIYARGKKKKCYMLAGCAFWNMKIMTLILYFQKISCSHNHHLSCHSCMSKVRWLLQMQAPSPYILSSHCMHFQWGPLFIEAYFWKLFFLSKNRLLSGVRVQGAGKWPLYHPYVGLLWLLPTFWNVNQSWMPERKPVWLCCLFSNVRQAVVMHLLRS